MSAMDEFTATKRQRDYLAKMEWFASDPNVRLFYPDGADRTREYNPDECEVATFAAACGASSRELGSCVGKIVLRCLDERLKELAKRARSEAEAVLAAIPA